MMKNIMEAVVSHKLDDFLSQYDICKCGHCKEDITACTLNQLPPKYAVTDEGELYAKVSLLSPEEEYALTIALAKAIKLISDNPRHK